MVVLVYAACWHVKMCYAMWRRQNFKQAFRLYCHSPFPVTELPSNPLEKRYQKVALWIWLVEWWTLDVARVKSFNKHQNLSRSWVPSPEGLIDDTRMTEFLNVMWRVYMGVGVGVDVPGERGVTSEFYQKKTPRQTCDSMSMKDRYCYCTKARPQYRDSVSFNQSATVLYCGCIVQCLSMAPVTMLTKVFHLCYSGINEHCDFYYTTIPQHFQRDENGEILRSNTRFEPIHLPPHSPIP